MPDGRVQLLVWRSSNCGKGVIIEIERTDWGHSHHLGRRRLPWGCMSACWVPQRVQRVPVPRRQPCRLQNLSCRRQITHHGQLLSSGCAPIWTWSLPLPGARRQCLPRDTLSIGDQVADNFAGRALGHEIHVGGVSSTRGCPSPSSLLAT